MHTFWMIVGILISGGFGVFFGGWAASVGIPWYITYPVCFGFGWGVAEVLIRLGLM